MGVLGGAKTTNELTQVAICFLYKRGVVTDFENCIKYSPLYSNVLDDYAKSHFRIYGSPPPPLCGNRIGTVFDRVPLIILSDASRALSVCYY